MNYKDTLFLWENKGVLEGLTKNYHKYETLSLTEREILRITKAEGNALRLNTRNEWDLATSSCSPSANVRYRVSDKFIPKKPKVPAKFFEAGVDHQGYYLNKDGHRQHCFAHMVDYNFAGIKYKGFDGWHMAKQLVRGTSLCVIASAEVNEDVTMAIPEKIRFFNTGYKEDCT